MLFVILGMHKSGTTLVAQTLHQSGIYMGNDFDSERNYYQGNHFESYEANLICADLLNVRFGTSSLKKIKIPNTKNQNWGQFQKLRELGIKNFVDRLQTGHQDWGIKSPWLSLVYPYWEKFLPPHRLIVVYRDPLHVFQHYFRGKNPLGLIRSSRALYQWKVYNRKIKEILDHTQHDYLVINYLSLLTEDKCHTTLENFTGRKLVDCRRTPKRKTHKLHGFLSRKIYQSRRIWDKEMDRIWTFLQNTEKEGREI